MPTPTASSGPPPMRPSPLFLAAQRSLLFLLTLAFYLSPLAQAEEEQAHGLAFEHWLADTFFSGYRAEGYTQKWDIPAEINQLPDPALRGLPVNPKATRLGSPIGLGDALRQYDIAEPFLLVVGFWRQSAPAEKTFVRIAAVRVEPEAWRALWAPLTRADLEQLEALVLDRSLSPAEARRRVADLKREPRFRAAAITLNPKIDARGQRRLQCSLREKQFWQLAGEGLAQSADASLWGVPFPGPIHSPSRRP
jgi:hypothetical protein